ncbi:hypothetical protein RvY_09695 [Ramazzottius varieornatus]|uniref:Uncharacterized protein n=1 Tax=Ramazzottius varieornatus TaxID=947166 RepID=A0A1D1VAC0_RAMVA|nr:hypothetical protein RvY_09695 [Ramazzottius varieornatus]
MKTLSRNGSESNFQKLRYSERIFEIKKLGNGSAYHPHCLNTPHTTILGFHTTKALRVLPFNRRY